MAVKYYNPDILDYGLSRVKTKIDAANTVKLHILKAYTTSDTYTTAKNTNSVGSVALASGDITAADQGTLGRQITIAAKSLTASADSGASPDLHVAILDETDSKILIVTDETSNQQIVNGNTINVPSWAAKMNQPT